MSKTQNSIKGTKKIVVDLNSQVVTAYLSSKVIYRFDCISGDEDHPTPSGIFKIFRKEHPYTSKKYKAPMNYAMFFNGGVALHQYHGPWTLVRVGRKISDWFGSHGCVRLEEENAKLLYEWAPKGTIVIVFAGNKDSNQKATISSKQ